MSWLEFFAPLLTHWLAWFVGVLCAGLWLRRPIIDDESHANDNYEMHLAHGHKLITNTRPS